jgi:hypothetical protein
MLKLLSINIAVGGPMLKKNTLVLVREHFMFVGDPFGNINKNISMPVNI